VGGKRSTRFCHCLENIPWAFVKLEQCGMDWRTF